MLKLFVTGFINCFFLQKTAKTFLVCDQFKQYDFNSIVFSKNVFLFVTSKQLRKVEKIS